MFGEIKLTKTSLGIAPNFKGNYFSLLKGSYMRNVNMMLWYNQLKPDLYCLSAISCKVGQIIKQITVTTFVAYLCLIPNKIDRG